MRSTVPGTPPISLDAAFLSSVSLDDALTATVKSTEHVSEACQTCAKNC
jgi:hypothetical protein